VTGRLNEFFYIPVVVLYVFGSGACDTKLLFCCTNGFDSLKIMVSRVPSSAALLLFE